MSALATPAVSAFTMGVARLPDCVAASASPSRSNSLALQALAMASAAFWGMMPTTASARARAASKSSMCCTAATASQNGRMPGLDSMGASRGESEVLMVRDLIIPASLCQSKSIGTERFACANMHRTPSLGPLSFGLPVRYLGQLVGIIRQPIREAPDGHDDER